MEIFEKNCTAIEGVNPALAVKLRSAEPGGDVVVEEAKSGGYTFKFKDRYFHSRYEPDKEARMQADEIVSRKPDWVVLFGLGCGYLLKALLSGNIKGVIVFEPSMTILRSVLEVVDLSEEIERDDVALFTDLVDVAAAVRNMTDGFDTLIGYQTDPYKSVFPAELADFTTRVQNAHITNKVSIRTDIDSRLKWIDNYFANISHLGEYPPVDSLRDAFKGLPLVIAGAGPSLKKNAHLLKGLKGKAVIIAAITAYKPLLKYGVVPDFIIASEKVDLPEYFSYGQEDKKTRLILSEISHPDMFGRDVKGKFTFFNAYFSLSIEQASLWGSDYFPSLGGSVTTAALDMGIMMGCDPIMFVGQDLSFGDGETHVPGGVYVSQDIRIDTEMNKVVVEDNYVGFENKVSSDHELLWLKGLDGKPVPSKFDWVTFHQWFEHYMANIRREGIKNTVINATEGGAYIEGMEHVTLAEAIERHVDRDFDIDELVQRSMDGRRPADADALVNSFKGIRSGIRYIDKMARGILKETARIRKTLGNKGLVPELNANVERIRRMEGEMFDESVRAGFIWEALSEYKYLLKEYLRQDEADTPAGIVKNEAEAITKTYRAVKEMCERFLPAVDEAVEAVSALDGSGAGEVKKSA